MAGDLSDIIFLQPTTALLGGAVGTDTVLSQTTTGLTDTTGVTIDQGCGNALGDGTISFTASSKYFTWTPNAGGTGAAVAVTADGTYAIQGSNDGGYLVITVVYADLPTQNTSDTITVAADMNELFDDVTKDESWDGVTRYRCVYAKNNNASDTKRGMVLWIGSNTTGADTVSIGLDPAGAGGTAATVADENTAPAGVTFTAPTTKATGLSIGNLATSQVYPFWIKEVVPAETQTATEPNHFKLSFYVLV